MTERRDSLRRIRCTICGHQERARAELLLAKGDGYTDVAKHLGLSVDALERHWKRHTTEEYREALKPGGRALAARHALTAQTAEDASSVLDNLKASRAGAWQLFAQELIAGSSTKAAMILAQHTKINLAIARITGELAASPLIANTTINNVTALFESPKFLRFEKGLVALARDYPELHPRLIELVKLLDDEEPGEPVTATRERPALEYEQATVTQESAAHGV